MPIITSWSPVPRLCAMSTVLAWPWPMPGRGKRSPSCSNDSSPRWVAPLPLSKTSQLPTFIHLGRLIGGIKTHNAVHRCEITEMLKASPQDFRPRSIASAPPDKPTELRDPLDGLTQRRRLGRRLRHPMNGTIERLPFIGLQQHATGHLRHRSSQHGGVQNPPRHHPVERQTALQTLGRLELTRFNAAPTFQNPMPNFNAPAARIPLHPLDGVLDRLDLNRGPQQPLDGLDLGRRIDLTHQDGPKGHRRQALGFAMAGRRHGQGAIAKRQGGLASGLRAATRDLNDDLTGHRLRLDTGPHVTLRRTDTAIPRGANQQVDTSWTLGGQHIVDIRFPVSNTNQSGAGTTLASGPNGIETVEPFLAFFLVNGPVLAPGAFADVVGVACPHQLS